MMGINLLDRCKYFVVLYQVQFKFFQVLSPRAGLATKYVCMVITYKQVRIKRERLPILPVVS